MKEYRLTLRMQIIFGLGLASTIFGLTVSALNVNKIQSLLDAYNILLVLLFGYLIYFFGNIFLMSRIIITEKSITYKSGKANWTTDWKDILKIGAKDGLLVHMEGLYIPGESTGMAFIPLSYFSNNWRDSELGQQIKQYAPHLFQ